MSLRPLRADKAGVGHLGNAPDAKCNNAWEAGPHISTSSREQLRRDPHGNVVRSRAAGDPEVGSGAKQLGPNGVTD
jgi:hypothetical protein